MKKLMGLVLTGFLMTSGVALASEGTESAQKSRQPQVGDRLELTVVANSGGSCQSSWNQTCHMSYDWGFQRYVCVCYNNDNGGS